VTVRIERAIGSSFVIEFNHRAILVCVGKGMKVRVVTLADTVI
jgi:hypothetical protein